MMNPTQVPQHAVRELRILIVDDHRTFVELLSSALDREVDMSTVGFARTAGIAVAECEALTPDVVVMDYHLADSNGLVASAQILARFPSIRIVMLTGDPTIEAIENAASIGVCAFLPKDGTLGALLDAIRHARCGGFSLSPALIPMLAVAHHPRENSRSVPVLSPRELEVLQLMGAGTGIHVNARTLGISENTCRGYVKSILSKLDAHTQLEAVAMAARLGLVGLG